MLIRFGCVLLLSLSGVYSHARGAERLVPAEYATVQSAIDAALPGDTIGIAGGVYTGDGNHSLDTRGKPLCIRPATPQATVILHALASRDDRRRHFWFHRGEDSTTRIERIILQGGWAPADGPFGDSRGGAVRCDSASSPLFVDCEIRNCAAATGGGGVVAQRYARPVFRRCRFEANESLHSAPEPTGGWGGAVSATGEAQARFESCVFVGNRGNLGGAVAAYRAHVVLDSCRFESNTAEAFVSLQPVAGGYGGAMLLDQSTAAVNACIFFANVARAHAAAPARGGAMALFFSFMEMRRSTLAENTAETNFNIAAEGAGLYCSFSSPRIIESILAFGRDAQAVFCIDSLSRPQLTCCDVYGNEEGDFVNCIASQAVAGGNFSLDPLFCDVTGGQLGLRDVSPCASHNSACGARVGALDVACVPTGVADPSDGVFHPDAAGTIVGYPSPFNASVTLRLTLGRSQVASVRIYNVLGEPVATLAHRAFSAGQHRLLWDGRAHGGRRAPSGVYFVLMETPLQRAVTRVVLLR